jgi:NADH-quinone oxidoreductase subunit M
VGISYHVGVDGLSAALVLLTGVLGPMVVLSSWTFVQERTKEFHIALLVLQTATFGAFCAIDTLLFFMFFEAVLIPMYLLIGVWGSEERQKAAVKFFLYTMVGSVLMLLALFAVYFLAAPSGARSFDYSTLYNGLMGASRELAGYLKLNPTGDGVGLSPVALALFRYGPYLFLAFALAFAIKVPMFPLHTWLPDAHVQAPVAGSMVLAGVMLKLGTYGFWRFAVPFFPVAARQFQSLFAVLALHCGARPGSVVACSPACSTAACVVRPCSRTGNRTARFAAPPRRRASAGTAFTACESGCIPPYSRPS